MSRNPFGWSYPAGAENDPNAPYNQVDPPDSCPVCGGEQYDEDGKPYYEDDPVFCSQDCCTAYTIMQESEAEAQYEEWKRDRDE